MPELGVFESVEFLEPKCPSCKNKIDYGITTRYDIRKSVHVCLKCGYVLK